MKPPPIASPCIDVCALDAAGVYCVGCFRTLGEIACWGLLDDAQRAAIMAALPERRRRLGTSDVPKKPGA